MWPANRSNPVPSRKASHSLMGPWSLNQLHYLGPQKTSSNWGFSVTWDIYWDEIILIPRWGLLFRSAEIREHLAQVIHSRNLPDPKTSIPSTAPQEAYSDCSRLHLSARTSHLCSLCLSLPWHGPLPTCPSGHILPRELPSRLPPEGLLFILSLPQPHWPSTELWPLRNPTALTKEEAWHDRVGVRPGSIQWGNRKAQGESKDVNRNYPLWRTKG